MQNKILHIIFCCLVFISQKSFSQNLFPVANSDFVFDFIRFDKQKGLSNNTIQDVFQDKYGFIWIATANGLNRFDGYNFRKYYHDANDFTTISDDFITDIDEDNKGNLWIATINGLNKYDRKNNIFIHYYHDFANSNSLSANHIRAIFCSPDGFIYAETSDGVMNKFNPKTGFCYHYRHRHITQNYYHYHTIVPCDSGGLYFGGRNLFPCHLDTVSGKITELFSNKDSNYIERADVSCIFIDNDKNLWVSGVSGATILKNNYTFSEKIQTSTFDIVSDKNGRLYFGTGNGLYIKDMDSDTVRVVLHDPEDVNSLSDNHINCLYFDNDDNLWIGTVDGLCLMAATSQRVLHFSHQPRNKNSLSENHISAVAEDLTGNTLFIGTGHQGVNGFDMKTNKITRLDKLNGRLISRNISCLHFDRQQRLWIGLWAGKGFNVYNTQTNETKGFRSYTKNTFHDWYSGFVSSGNDTLIIAMWGGKGIYFFDKTNGKFQKPDFVPVLKLKEKKMKDLIKITNNVFWYIDDNHRIISLKTDLLAVKKIINRIEAESPDFNKALIKDNYLIKDIPPGDMILSLGKTKKDKIIIRTNKGLFVYDYEKDVYKSAEKSVDLLKIADSVYINGEGKVFYTGNDVKININLNSFRYPLIAPSIKIERIRRSGTNSLLLQTNYGPMIYNIYYKNLSPYRTNEMVYYGLPVHLTTCVEKQNDSILWFGTTKEGLVRLNINNGVLENFGSDLRDSTKLHGETISCLLCDKEGKIWIGAYGLNCYNPADESFTHYNILGSKKIYALTEDKKGNIFISTNKGLARLDNDFRNVKHIDIINQSYEPELTGALKILKNGYLFVGTKTGFFLFHPDSINKISPLPPIRLTAFYINHILSGFDPEAEKHIFNYRQNTLTFEFAALDYVSAMQAEYKYRLKGLDNKWINTGAGQRLVRYSKLPPGNYIFEVKMPNNHRKKAGFSFAFTVEGPFYKQWWFISLVVLLLMTPIGIFIMLYIRRIREEKHSLQLEQQLLLSQMNPHFLFNSLNAIQSYIYDRNPLQAASYLSKFSHLMRQILNHSTTSFINLETEIETLKLYLDLQKIRFEDKFDYEVEIINIDDLQSVILPPMLAQPFIENSIEHGFKNIDYQGYIKIIFKVSDEDLIISVEDNGKGIDAARKEKAGEKAHKSLATVISRKRVLSLYKIRRKNYGIFITDLKNNENKSSGTKVVIKIPCKIMP